VEEARKSEKLADIMDAVAAADASPDRRRALRDGLVHHECERNKAGVLLADSSYAKQPVGISGDLKRYIPALAEKNEELRKFFYNLPADGTLVLKIDALYNVMYHQQLWVDAFNLARVERGDWHQDQTRDWYIPFMLSQGIFQEHAYRETLGLPSNIEAFGFGVEKELSAFLSFSAWPQIICSDIDQPRLAWEDGWKKVMGVPSPFEGK
jgi:hypothetical protein